MKHYLSAIIILSTITCKAQDTTSHLNKHSISFNAGVNMITGFAPLPINAGPWFDPVLPGTTIQPYFSLSYNYLLHKSNHFSLGLKLGMGYEQNTYAGYIPWEISYFGPLPLAQINTGEFTTGIFANFTRKDIIGWYNELDFTGSVQLYSVMKTTLISPNELANKNDVDMHLFYQSGISIRINKNFTLIPLLGCSLFDITALFNRNNIYGIYGYEYIRGSMTITYTFNKT